MKRDMDLVREILKKIYEHEHDSLPSLEIPNQSQEKVMYHVQMLIDTNLVNAFDASSSGEKYYLDLSLTWDGQDFIEAALDDTKWNKAKKIVLDTVDVLTIETLKIVLKDMMLKPFLQ